MKVRCLHLVVLLPALMAPQSLPLKPRWTSTRSHRVLIEVPARDLGSRTADEMPARAAVDFEKLLPLTSKADLSTLQLVRLNRTTGEPLPYTKNLYQQTPLGAASAGWPAFHSVTSRYEVGTALVGFW